MRGRVGCVLALAALLSGCGERQPARMYEGPDLPRSETSLVVVQPDQSGMMLRIEAVDGVRAPGAQREFHDRDRAVVVRAGSHTVEVRGWGVQATASAIVASSSGVDKDYLVTVTMPPRVVTVTAEGGRDYEIQFRRPAFDTNVRHADVPLRVQHTQEWLVTVVDRAEVAREQPAAAAGNVVPLRPE